jgi:hypothetical protein
MGVDYSLVMLRAVVSGDFAAFGKLVTFTLHKWHEAWRRAREQSREDSTDVNQVCDDAGSRAGGAHPE